MNDLHSKAVEIIGRIEAVPTILETVCGVTGMGFAAVARVTAEEWVAYAVRDEINFGLVAGGDLRLDTTICNEIRESRQAVIIPDTLADPIYCDHHTPRMYGFRSYVSYPIILADGDMWGTLCAIDPQPKNLDRPEVRNLFRMFADLIGFHLNMAGLLAISEANLGAELASGLKREQFIAILGHDLRNPVAAFQAGISLLKRKPDEQRRALILDRMQESTDRMAHLIDDILDFARGRLGGGIALQTEPVDIDVIITQIVGELASAHLDREVVIKQNVDRLVSCDKRRIEQLVSNLVGNALTHGAKDQPICIMCDTSQGELQICVSNGGPAISEEAQGTLFQPYERGGQSDAREGLGLGLYIASMIAAAHRGKVTVASSPEETRFTFTMPLQPAEVR